MARRLGIVLLVVLAMATTVVIPPRNLSERRLRKY
jgi:hypothetical protein